VFAEYGLEAPMHEVAAAAGAGVASIYRIFPSKHDLWTAIVIRRVGEMAAAFEQAFEQPGERWEALVDAISTHVARQSPEPFFNEARAVVEDRPEVAAAIARNVTAQARLLDAARTEGRLRADAGPEDLRLAARSRPRTADARADARRARQPPRLVGRVGFARSVSREARGEPP
jgi:AcrR family transcriptional regulator